jgi:hypothetical protein
MADARVGQTDGEERRGGCSDEMPGAAEDANSTLEHREADDSSKRDAEAGVAGANGRFSERPMRDHGGLRKGHELPQEDSPGR